MGADKFRRDRFLKKDSKYYSICELLKYSYKGWQHTKRFVADKLVQTDMFIYCFDAFLDNNICIN